MTLTLGQKLEVTIDGEAQMVVVLKKPAEKKPAPLCSCTSKSSASWGRDSRSGKPVVFNGITFGGTFK